MTAERFVKLAQELFGFVLALLKHGVAIALLVLVAAALLDRFGGLRSLAINIGAQDLAYLAGAGALALWASR